MGNGTGVSKSKPRAGQGARDVEDLRIQSCQRGWRRATRIGRGDQRVRLAFSGNMIDRPTPANRWCRKRLSSEVTARSALKSAPDGLSLNA